MSDEHLEITAPTITPEVEEIAESVANQGSITVTVTATDPDAKITRVTYSSE